MTAKEYLAEVAATIATHGHRDVPGFMFAVSAANQCARFTYSETTMFQEAVVVRDDIEGGLKNYVPGVPGFDATTAVAYSTLVAKFNSLL